MKTDLRDIARSQMQIGNKNNSGEAAVVLLASFNISARPIPAGI